MGGQTLKMCGTCGMHTFLIAKSAPELVYDPSDPTINYAEFERRD